MADIDLSKFIDNSLAAEFAAKPYNPARGINLFIDALNRTREQFNSSEPSKAPNKWFKAQNGIVAFTAKMNGNVIPVEGNDTNFIPSAQFDGFLTALSTFVGNGKLDPEIKSALAAKGKAGAASSAKSGAKGTLDTMSKVKQSVSRQSNVLGKSADEIRADLTARGVHKAWIDEATAGLSK